MLGISRSSLYNLMREGKLSYVMVGRQRRLLVSDLETYTKGYYVPARPSIL
jgi:excisionase family DNA binding protein